MNARKSCLSPYQALYSNSWNYFSRHAFFRRGHFGKEKACKNRFLSFIGADADPVCLLANYPVSCGRTVVYFFHTVFILGCLCDEQLCCHLSSIVTDCLRIKCLKLGDTEISCCYRFGPAVHWLLEVLEPRVGILCCD